jgi:hypothetical protein
VKHIDVTPEMEAALDALARALASYVPGRDSASVIELPKLDLADALLRALQLARVPKPTPATVAAPARRSRQA